jgi:NTP pyrophosphatase (non-canonical NTP hydrolase)
LSNAGPFSGQSKARNLTHNQSLQQLQTQVDQWANRYWGGEYWPPLANLARLIEEAGELSRALNQQHGEKRLKAGEQASDVELELGDLLFVIACIANSTGADLQRGFDAALEKYRLRDESDSA